MGITIHYSGLTKNLNTINILADILTNRAREEGYQAEVVNSKGYIALSIICFGDHLHYEELREWFSEKYLRALEIPMEKWPEIVKPVGFIDKKRNCYGAWDWIWSNPERYRYKYPSRIKGVVVSNPTSESFNFLWYRVGNYWLMSEFTKTQPFSLKEVKPNIKFHKFICDFLRIVKESSGLLKFYVFDEGGYWDSQDLSTLVSNFDANYELIAKIAGMLTEMGKDYGFSVKTGKKLGGDK